MTAPNDGVTYREMLATGRFYYGAEVVTTRGLEPVDSPGNLASFAKDLLADPRIGWISITDNPGGGPMLPPDWLAGLVADRRGQRRPALDLQGHEPQRHRGGRLALRLGGLRQHPGHHGRLSDRRLRRAGRAGVRSRFGRPDRRSCKSMNDGLAVPGRSGKPETLPKTNFFIGCVVSPFKRHERELVPQYFKLVRKIAAGARWVIPQFGYDMRKFHEVKLFLDARGIQVPVIGNVYLLTKGVAKLFNSGKLAGCVVSDELLRKIEKYAAGPDKGKKFCQELAAKQLAVFKGLGFAAGYLGGIHKADGFGPIIDLAESYGPDDWREFLKEIQFSQPDEFFLFEHDRCTGLSDAGADQPRVSRLAAASAEVEGGDAQLPAFALGTRLGVHARQGAVSAAAADLSPAGTRSRASVSRMAYRIERASKLAMYGCQDCGDCSLPDCAYLCPQARVLEVRPQRPLRRLGRRPLRIGRQGMLLGSRLRAAEELRRVGDDARSAA